MVLVQVLHLSVREEDLKAQYIAAGILQVDFVPIDFDHSDIVDFPGEFQLDDGVLGNADVSVDDTGRNQRIRLIRFTKCRKGRQREKQADRRKSSTEFLERHGELLSKDHFPSNVTQINHFANSEE